MSESDEARRGEGASGTSEISLPVLIIDDESLVRRSLVRLLKTQGIRALEADGGQAGLDALARQAFAAIVLDLSMPKMGGTECLRRIRLVDENTPIILASGYPEDSEVQELLRAGANGFIGKPYSVQALMTGLRAVIDPTRGAGLQSAPGEPLE